MDIKETDLGQLMTKLSKLMQRPMHPKVSEFFTKLGTDAAQAALGTGVLIRGVKIKLVAEFLPLEKDHKPTEIGLGGQTVDVDLSVVGPGGQTEKVDSDFANKPVSSFLLGDRNNE